MPELPPKTVDDLFAQAETWRTLADLSSDFMMISDTDGRILHINRVLPEYSSRESVVGTFLTDHVPADQREHMLQHIQHVLKTGESAMWEIRYDGPDHGSRIFQSVISPIRRDGRIIAIAHAARDVTDRADIVRRLEEKRRRLDQAQRLAGVGWWEWNIDAGTATWSDEMYEIWRVDAASFTPALESVVDTIHPDDRDRVQRALDAHLSRGEAYSTEMRIRRGDGSTGHVHASGYAEMVDGKATRMTGLVQDLTARRRSEDLLSRISGAAAKETGDAFFRAVATELASGLGVRYALVGKLLPGGRRIRTVAACADGVIVENLEYDLEGTPCANVMARGFCAYQSGVQADFPADTLLVEMGVESYLGTPLFDRSGQLLGLLTVLDVDPVPDDLLKEAQTVLQIFADRAAAELERSQSLAALRDSEERVRLLLDSIAEGVYGLDLDGRCTFANPSCVRMLGYGTPDELLGREMRGLVHDAPATSSQDALETHSESEILRRRDGSTFPVELWSYPIRRDDEIVGSVVTFIDITERRRAEQRQRILMDELDHRVKNTLSVVLALSSQTMSATESLPAFQASFEGRLRALAQAHEALAAAQWESVPLHDALRGVLATYVWRDEARVHLDGPEIHLPAIALSPVCLSVHELLTNAVKYGALSGLEGHVDIHWTLSDGELAMTWTEHGGPAPEPGMARGLGLTLVAGLIESELGGQLDVGFEPEGLRASFAFPLVTLVEA